MLGDAAPLLGELWRDKQLQYSWLRAVQGRHADFWQVTGDALDFALEALALTDRQLRDRLMQLYLTLDPYPEAAAVLRQLRDAGFATAVLSNGSPAMLMAAIDHAGLGDLFDHVLSVEEVGVYKPHPRVYQLGGRPPRHAGAANRVCLVERLGRLGRLGLRHAGRLVQPPGPAPASGCPALPTARSVRSPNCRRCWRADRLSATAARSTPVPRPARGFWRR